MPNYAFAYYGEPKFESPEAGAASQAKWKAWLVSLGDAVVNPGIPLGFPKIVSASGISDDDEANRLTGFSILKADNIDAALELAKGCPFLDYGTVHVAEAFQM